MTCHPTRIGALLHLRRLDKQWTLKQCAAAAELSLSFISDIERGRTIPSLGGIQQIARAFGMEAGDFLVLAGYTTGDVLPDPLVEQLQRERDAAVQREAEAKLENSGLRDRLIALGDAAQGLLDIRDELDPYADVRWLDDEIQALRDALAEDSDDAPA